MKIKIGQKYYTDEEEFEITKIKDGFVTIEIKQYGNCFRKGRTFRLKNLLEDIETGICKINEKSKDAECLFEELGYSQYIFENGEISYGDSCYQFTFNHRIKKVRISDNPHHYGHIEPEVFQAITKQMEELGWL